jgi:hypothetical protein
MRRTHGFYDRNPDEQPGQVTIKSSFEVQAYHPMQQDILAEVAEKALGIVNSQVNIKRGLFYLGELLDQPGVYTLGETRNLRTRYSGHQRDRINRDFRYIRVDGVDGFYDKDRKRLESIGLRLFQQQFNRRVGSDGVLTDWYDIPTREQAIEAFKKICLEHSTNGGHAHETQCEQLPDQSGDADAEVYGESFDDFDEPSDYDGDFGF